MSRRPVGNGGLDLGHPGGTQGLLPLLQALVAAGVDVFVRLEVAARIREDATVADLAGRDAERLPSELGKGSRQMMTMLSGFASAFATMVPEFEAMGRDLERSMKDIKAARD